MKILCMLLTSLRLAFQSVEDAAGEVVVYPPVPGLAASALYEVRVRPVVSGGECKTAFASETTCKTIEVKTDDHWSGGRVLNMRGEGGRAAGAGVIFRDINIEDPRPTLQQFFFCMNMPEPYSKNAEKRAAGDLSGILFQNISIAAPSVLGEPQILRGQADARIRSLTFDNLTVAGKPVRDAKFFQTNEFVDGVRFLPPPLANP